jgi:antitoxin component YwqK of YwqJK toxin-antitoxin module
MGEWRNRRTPQLFVLAEDKSMKIVIAGLFFIIFACMAQTTNASENDLDCARSFCGCSTEIEIQYETTVVSAGFIPQPNIKVSCPENRLLATSDKFGKVTFTLKTTQSPGCGVACGELTFTRETPALYEAWKINIDNSSTGENRTILGQHYQKGERKNGENDGRWQEWCLNEQWGSNGKLRVSGSYKKGLKHGNWAEWSCSGKIQHQGKYEYGKKEGIWQSWYENGRKKSIGSYEKDIMHGEWTYWAPSGHKISQGEFKYGKREGLWREWWDNGNNKEEVRYRNNMMNGKSIYWSPSGQIISEGEWRNNKPVRK